MTSAFWSKAVLSLAAALLPAHALAYYEESHVTGDEARVTVDASAGAKVEHVLSWHIVAGQYHALDVAGVSGTPLPEASAIGEDGKVFPGTVLVKDATTLRVVFEEPKGLRHGHYKVHLAYRTDLVDAHALARDGAMWRLSFKGPRFPEGYDGAKVTFELPASADEPRLSSASGEGQELGILENLRRSQDKDELELVKPHVAQREEVSWTIRVSPRAFPGVKDPTLRPPVRASMTAPQREIPPLLLFAAALLAGAAYGLVARAKALRFERAARGRSIVPEGIVPLRPEFRLGLAGAAFGAGVLLQASGLPTLGGVGVAAAMLLVAIRPPRRRSAPRGPGFWLALKPADAFPRTKIQDPFDPRTLLGLAAALGVVGLVGVAGWGLSFLTPKGPWLAALDALALLPLVLTGRSSQLPPDAFTGSSWLKKLHDRLSRKKNLRVTPWARVPTGATTPDEIRLRVVPKSAMGGLLGIEAGLVFWHASTWYAEAPEVLVRVQESSAASARMTTLAAWVTPVPGRKPEERVYRLAPRVKTREGTAALVLRLGSALSERRSPRSVWDKVERRLPPSEREKPLENAA